MIEIVRTLNALDELKSQWSEILPERPSPMLSFEWVRAAAQAFYKPKQICIVVVRGEDRRLDAVAPLVRNRNNYLSSVSLIGSNYLFEPTGLLFRNTSALRELVLGLIGLKVPLNLKRLVHTEVEIEQITSNFRDHSLLLAKSGNGTPFLLIGSTWREYEKSISSRRRSDLRRALRRAEDFGNVEFEVKTSSPKDNQAHFDELVRVELNSWKGRAGTAMGLSRQYHQFFSEFVRSCAQQDTIKFGFMRINGKPVAVNLSIQFGASLWVLKVGYDEKFGRCSPGILLMHEMVRYAFEQKLRSFEFLGESEKWIKLWSPRVLNSSSLRIFPRSVGGLGHFGAVAADAGLRMAKCLTQHALDLLVECAPVPNAYITKGKSCN